MSVVVHVLRTRLSSTTRVCGCGCVLLFDISLKQHSHRFSSCSSCRVLSILACSLSLLLTPPLPLPAMLVLKSHHHTRQYQTLLHSVAFNQQVREKHGFLHLARTILVCGSVASTVSVRLARCSLIFCWRENNAGVAELERGRAVLHRKPRTLHTAFKRGKRRLHHAQGSSCPCVVCYLFCVFCSLVLRSIMLCFALLCSVVFCCVLLCCVLSLLSTHHESR